MIKIKGYTIRYNPFWKFWSVGHDVVGAHYFDSLKDALSYAKRG